MPYIDKGRRLLLQPSTEVGGDKEVTSAGELNYMITMLCLDYLKQTGYSYSTLNSIVGALECAKQEFYRRAAVPYEDIKMRQNGDVYDYSE
jgi:hypothetical protein